ncbi:MAG: hypothetical protein M1837_003591 [Sclerophora amabilis]|nr:MAG: hypothetical protein M1837_003591 [Sclerophora amabilis]
MASLQRGNRHVADDLIFVSEKSDVPSQRQSLWRKSVQIQARGENYPRNADMTNARSESSLKVGGVIYGKLILNQQIISGTSRYDNVDAGIRSRVEDEFENSKDSVSHRDAAYATQVKSRA